MIPRGMSPALVESEDFIILDFDGKVVWGKGHPNAEWPIHASIYQARSDVHSVVHSHSRLSRIFSISSRQLYGVLTSSAPEWQSGIAVYREAGLVTSRERGDAVARVLANGSALLLRGHGDVIATESITSTVLKSIVLQQNADVLHEVMCHAGEVELWDAAGLAAWSGPPKTLSSEAREALGARAWDYYEARVNGRLQALLSSRGRS